jgi:2'-5' RNA ligase
MDEAQRLFIGVRLSMAALRALEGFVPKLKARAHELGVPVRWIPPENYHVTLKFLGWTRAPVSSAIRDHLRKAVTAVAPFTFEVCSVGAFPDARRASVLWAGVGGDGAKALTELAGHVDTACQDLGFSADERAYHPHVTVGRLRDPKNVTEMLLPFQELKFEPCHAEELVLYQSKDGGGSVHYEERAVIKFG